MATIDYKQKIKDYMNSSEVDTLYKSMLNNLFPELKENKDKDEKTRKSLIILLQHFCKGYRVPGLDFPVSYKDMLAWLEKQGEHSNFLSKIQVGDKVTRNEDGVLVNLSQLKRIAKPAEEHNITGIGSKSAQGKLGEMIKNLKPVNEVLEQGFAWSEEDEKQARQIERIVHNDGCTQKLQKQIANWLKSLKDRVQSQPKHRWSEEDKKIIDRIESEFLALHRGDYKNIDFNNVDNLSVLNWVRKIKFLCFQSRWKPSDEQLKALDFYIRTYVDTESCYGSEVLELYEQLKELIED